MKCEIYKNIPCNLTLGELEEKLKEEKKQGALKELKEVLKLIDVDFENDSWVKTSNYCIERIKELEEGVEK